MQDKTKDVLKSIYGGITYFFIHLSKFSFSFSFIFVLFFLSSNALLSLLFFVLMLVGFIKTEHYKYIRWKN